MLQVARVLGMVVSVPCKDTVCRMWQFGFWFVVCAQKGAILQFVPYTLVSIDIAWNIMVLSSLSLYAWALLNSKWVVALQFSDQPFI